MQFRKRYSLATAKRNFRAAAFSAIGVSAGSVGFLLSLNLIIPDKPFLVGLISVCLISFSVAFSLLSALGFKDAELKRMQSKVNYAVRHDATTGALNGTAFAAAVEHYVDRRKLVGDDSGGVMIAVVVEALDDISHRFGSQWADSVMHSLAAIIQSSGRSGDLIARLATNEFGVFLPGATAANAEDIGERIRRRLAQTAFAAEETPLDIDVKIGGALFEGAPDFNSIRRLADETAFAGRSKAGALPLSRLPPA